MRKRAPSERKFAGRSPDVRRTFAGFSPDFQRDMHVISLPVWGSENRPKAGITGHKVLNTPPLRMQNLANLGGGAY